MAPLRSPVALAASTALAATLVVAGGAGAAGAEVTWSPRVGVEFEHFGETYQVTDDADTVATIDDIATRLGLVLDATGGNDRRLRARADVLLGRQGRRVRLDAEGRWRSGANLWELEHDGSWRVYSDDGDYSVAGDVFQDWIRIGWERRLGEGLRVRLRDALDVTRYGTPDTYRLDQTLHRPSVDLRVALGDLDELRLAWEYGRRDVPDSSSLDYRRQVGEVDLALLAGAATTVDASSRVERRTYPDGSVRASFWEHRGDLLLGIDAGDRTTYRLVHENEWVRYDDPDALDFDSFWTRTGVQGEVHLGPALDLSVMPLYGFLVSDTSPGEEYDEIAVELGLDWRIGETTWIHATEEVGRRDYELADPVEDVLLTDLEAVLAAESDVLDTAWSDYVYHRLTLFVTTGIAKGVSANLFVTWQPEDHRVNRHDTETRIVSGGIEYRF